MNIFIIPSMLIVFGILNAQAQEFKKRLDTTAVNHWGYVSDAQISHDGRFAGFVSQYGIRTNFSNPKTLTIRSTSGTINRTYGPGIKHYSFSGDNKYVYVLNNRDTLKIIHLSTGSLKSSYSAISYKELSLKDRKYIMISCKNGDLKFIDINRNREYLFSRVTRSNLTKSNDGLFEIKDDNTIGHIDLLSMKETILGRYQGVRDLIVDDGGKKIAFIQADTVWTWDVGQTGAKKALNPTSEHLPKNFSISTLLKFGQDENGLFVYLLNKPKPESLKKDSVKVRVWNYQDTRLQSDPGNIGRSQPLLFLLDLKIGSLSQIQELYETTRFLNDNNTELIAIARVKGADYERHWNRQASPRYFMYSTSSKERHELNFQPFFLSPDGKYVVGYDSAMVDYKVWDVQTKKTNDLTQNLEAIADQSGKSTNDLQYWKFQGWTNMHDLLLSDGNDIWNFDLSRPSSGTVVTNGYGKLRHITFSVPNTSFGKVFTRSELNILAAFDNKTKQSGYFKLNPRYRDPEKLIMSDALYSSYLAKASHSPFHIVLRERADTSPNFFLTSDFKSFTALSTMYPEQHFKWLKSELFDFRTVDGKQSQAIVYKPQDWTGDKKYPVIFYCYERFSDELHRYIRPEMATGDLDIPWFVSKGYIIIKPDIIYTQQKAYESALATVGGLKSELYKVTIADTSRVGVIGHSWGAAEVNYFIAHSKIFDAAVSACGNSNLISAVTSIHVSGANFVDLSTHTRYERFGKTLWERPDLYIKNSPILDVDKISTPVLLMANKNDAVINVEQGLGFFWALRRLGKRAWLLQYEDEAHTLGEEMNQNDYSNKVMDFFNHYLKGKPMSDWMEEHN